MKLGNDRVVVITRSPRLTADGQRVLDEYRAPIIDETATLVRWCLVTPQMSSESDDRTAPSRVGAGLLAPAGTALPATSVVLWPVTGPDDGPWTGPRWEVSGEALPWPDCIEANLVRTG